MKRAEITFGTRHSYGLTRITDKVNKALEELGAGDGVCNLFAPHATGVIVILEDEQGLKNDFLKKARELFPPGAGYEHDRIDDNAHSHLMSTFLGESKTIPVKNGRLDLGTWQDVFWLETDGPRPRRRVIVSYWE